MCSLQGLAPIDFTPMTDPDDEDCDDLIHYGADDPVVTHPVFPELTKLLAGQWLAEGAWIVQRGDSFTQHLDNPTLNDPIQLGEFVNSLGFEFNLPGQVSSARFIFQCLRQVYFPV